MTKPEPIKRVDPPVERITDDPPRQVPLDAAAVTAALAEVGRQLRAAFAPPRPARHAELLNAIRREVDALGARTGTPSRLLSGRHTWQVGVDPTEHKVDSVVAAALAYDLARPTVTAGDPGAAGHPDAGMYYGTPYREFTSPPAPAGARVHGIYVNGQAVELEDGTPVKVAAGDSIRITTHTVDGRVVARVHIAPKAEPMPKRPKRRELEAELQRVRNQVTELEAQLLTARARNSRLTALHRKAAGSRDWFASQLEEARCAAERHTPAPGPYRPACGSLAEHSPHPIGADGRYCYGCHDYGAPDDPQIRVAPAGTSAPAQGPLLGVQGAAGGVRAQGYRIKDNPQA
jgi:hypothetical protein